jgi:hypothetical protein
VAKYDVPVQKKGKKSKFDRVFGEDASRIRREAAKLSESKPKSKGKNSAKTKKR